MALSAIGEGCHQQMESILNEIVSFVLLFCQDPVSHATIFCDVFLEALKI